MKVTTKIKNKIVNLSIEGFSSERISQEIEKAHGVYVAPRSVRHHQQQQADKIGKGIKQQIMDAESLEPFAILSHRLQRLQQIYDRASGDVVEITEQLENVVNGTGTSSDRKALKKQVRELYKEMNEAVKNAATDVTNMQRLLLKKKEIAKKNGIPDYEETVEIIETVSRKMDYREAEKKHRESEAIAVEAGWIEEPLE